MQKDTLNIEALQALEDINTLLTNQISVLADLSNSIGSALASLDKDDYNPEAQEKIEEASLAIDAVVGRLKTLIEEAHEQNEEEE